MNGLQSAISDPDKTSAAKALSIVLVEDDLADAAFLQEILLESSNTHLIHTFQNGEDAITYLKHDKNEPDLILLDITLPMMDGFKTLSILSENAATEATPIFMLTASDEMADVLKAQELGADGYIVKPMIFSLDDLISAVDCVTNIPGAFIKVGKQ